MKQLRIKLDLPFEYVLRLAEAIADDEHACEQMEMFYDEKAKPECSKFYGRLASQARIIKEELNLQIEDPKNVYMGGCEDESAGA